VIYIFPPDVKVMSENARTGYEVLNYVVYVDATVYNMGGDCKVTVWAKLTQRLMVTKIYDVIPL